MKKLLVEKKKKKPIHTQPLSCVAVVRWPVGGAMRDCRKERMQFDRSCMLFDRYPFLWQFTKVEVVRFDRGNRR